MIIRPAESDSEVKKAFEVASKIFESRENCDEEALKKTVWFEGASLLPESLILCVENEKICGLLRLIPVTFPRGAIQYEAVCMSSIGLLSEVRGRGYSRHLMEESIQICQKRGFDFAYLIARRAVDHYYPRFGFVGASSYEAVLLQPPSQYESPKSSEFTVEGRFVEDEMGSYQEAYESSYSNCFGRAKRSNPDWKFIYKRVQVLRDYEFKTLQVKGQTLGYLIQKGNEVLEVSCLERGRAHWVEWFKQSGVEKVHIPREHSLRGSFRNEDVTFTSRSCLYGGHMIRILNSESVKTKRKALDSGLQEEEGLSDVESLLGIRIGAGVNQAFNLSFPEQL